MLRHAVGDNMLDAQLVLLHNRCQLGQLCWAKDRQRGFKRWGIGCWVQGAQASQPLQDAGAVGARQLGRLMLHCKVWHGSILKVSRLPAVDALQASKEGLVGSCRVCTTVQPSAQADRATSVCLCSRRYELHCGARRVVCTPNLAGTS